IAPPPLIDSVRSGKSPAARPYLPKGGHPMTVVTGKDTAKTRRTLSAGGKTIAYYSIPAAQAAGLGDFSKLPASLKVVLENLLRFEDGGFTVSVDDIKAFGDWAKQ